MATRLLKSRNAIVSEGVLVQGVQSVGLGEGPKPQTVPTYLIAGTTASLETGRETGNSQLLAAKLCSSSVSRALIPSEEEGTLDLVMYDAILASRGTPGKGVNEVWNNDVLLDMNNSYSKNPPKSGSCVERFFKKSRIFVTLLRKKHSSLFYCLSLIALICCGVFLFSLVPQYQRPPVPVETVPSLSKEETSPAAPPVDNSVPDTDSTPQGAVTPANAPQPDENESKVEPEVDDDEEEEEQDPQVALLSDANQQRDAVRAAFVHAWEGYASKCFGKDEIDPVSGNCENWLNQGATVIDAIDTMRIMALDDHVERVHKWIVEEMDVLAPSGFVSFFETTIRVLGGLLTEYEASQDPAVLEKARILGKALSAAFHPTSGLPYPNVNLRNGQVKGSWAGSSSLLAEIGTIQLEFSALSRHTGDPYFQNISIAIFDWLRTTRPNHKGLYPIYISTAKKSFTRDVIAVGAMGDSFYEYLLKLWLLLGKKEDRFREMYVESADSIISVILSRSVDGLLYSNDLESGQKRAKMDHLACFLPGMLALGVHTGAVEGERADIHMQAAEGLTETCYEMYRRQPTGIAPETVGFNQYGMYAKTKYYLLRPEAVESMFLMWRITGQQKYRDWAWEVFQAIEKNCKTPLGYSPIRDVTKSTVQLGGKMESFLFAETFKYLYLIFSPNDVIPLDQYVFNTEAHPLQVFPSKA